MLLISYTLKSLNSIEKIQMKVMCTTFNGTLNSKPLKSKILKDPFKNLSSNISSTENYVNIHI